MNKPSYQSSTASISLIASVTKPVLVLGSKASVGLSVGISIFPNDGKQLSTLLKKADQSMYGVKQSGKNGVSVFPASKET